MNIPTTQIKIPFSLQSMHTLLKSSVTETLILLSLFMLTSASFLIPTSTGEGAYSTSFTLEKVDGAPEPTYRLLYVPNANALFVTTRNGTVWKFDGSRWQLTLDTKRNLICFPNLDSQGNIYISVWDHLYRSSDNGNTWSLVFSHPYCLMWHIADLGNGTLIGDNWVSPQGPYLWRSENWGETWYLWKNFTEMFPQYAVQSPRHEEGSYLLRHLHHVAYDNYTGNIIVSTGDDIRHLFITSDGKTWEEIDCEGYTGIMIMEDRILYGPDHNYGLTIYDRNTGTYRIVYRKFGAEDINIIRIDDFAYDDKTGTIYAGILGLEKNHYGIICSQDKGETWTTLYQQKTSIGVDLSVVFLSIFNNYLYVSIGDEPNAKLYRIALLVPQARAHLSVSVEDQHGMALPEAEVTVNWLNGTAVQTLQTNEDGLVTFHQLPIGSYTVTATYQQLSSSQRIDLNEDKSISIRITGSSISEYEISLYILLISVIIALTIAYAIYHYRSRHKRARTVLRPKSVTKSTK